jgi:hypothetical protein
LKILVRDRDILKKGMKDEKSKVLHSWKVQDFGCCFYIREEIIGNNKSKEAGELRVKRRRL